MLQLNKSVMLLPLFCAGTQQCCAVSQIRCLFWLKTNPETMSWDDPAYLIYLQYNLFVFLGWKHPDNSFGKLARCATSHFVYQIMQMSRVLFLHLPRKTLQCHRMSLWKWSLVKQDESLIALPELTWLKVFPSCNFLGAFIKSSWIQECF